MFWLRGRCPSCFFPSRCSDMLIFLFGLLFLLSCTISIDGAKWLMWLIRGNQSWPPYPSTWIIPDVYIRSDLWTTTENWWSQQRRSNCPALLHLSPGIPTITCDHIEGNLITQQQRLYVHTMQPWVSDFVLLNLDLSLDRCWDEKLIARKCLQILREIVF